MENNLNKVNNLILSNTDEYVKTVENEYHLRIKKVANDIVNSNKRIILLAGPSASGKTTTAHLLSDYLKEASVHTEIISLDDFFLEQHQMPYDEHGVIDYESVHSLDTKGIKKALNDLNEFGKTDLPVFSFYKKCREDYTRHIDIGGNGAVIVEGLHALNPLIANSVNAKHVLKLYISVAASYFDAEGKELLESRNIRLMRRMSRDILYRGSTPESCLELFKSVVRGEEKYLCPFRYTADIQMCSFHDYEICVFKPLLLDILKGLQKSVDNYDRVTKIINAMEQTVEINQNKVPKSSLLNEFIGN